MNDSAIRTDASLPEVLIAHARSASDGRLALDLILGAAAALGIIIWHPGAWLLLFSVALCFVAFGAWGITDRELLDSAGHSPRLVKILRATRATAAGVGGAAGATVLMSGFALLLGTWIS